MTNITVNLWFNHPELALPNRPDLGVMPHAQEAMRALGIFYKSATAHPIADCWRFYDCENIPDTLPSWATREEPEGVL